MIRYPKADGDLLAEIESEAPGWLAKAEKRVDLALKPSKKFHKSTVAGAPAPNWSDVKQVYRDLQGDKCAYCERPLPIDTGSGEHHIEHFRPKGSCQPWSSPSTVTLAHLEGRLGGYYWLAYDPWNYTASCYTCNTGEYKGDRFPIEGERGRAHWQIPTLDSKEKPVLIYPIGSRDSDPEDLIGWRSVVPMAKPGPGRERAVANIEFYGLANRPNLDRGRAPQLVAAWAVIKREREAAAEAAAHPDDAAKATAHQQAAADLARLQGRRRPHAACVRAFVALAATNLSDAEQVYEDALALFLSLDGG